MKPEITAVIVEDIKDYHRVIESFVSEVAPQVRIVANAYTLKEAETLIRGLSPMLLFLDIQFEAEGQTAFDLLNKLAEYGGTSFQVIITTAHSEQKYYAEAFNYGAVHFLTKPIDKPLLKEAIDRAEKNLLESRINQAFDQILQIKDKHQPGKKVEKILIEGTNFTEITQITNIVYLEASGRYTYIYLNSNGVKPICSTKNLGEYEKMLHFNTDFFRIHRNKIINLSYVQRFFKKDNSFVLPPPFEKQFASKDRFKEFMKKLEDQNDLI